MCNAVDIYPIVIYFISSESSTRLKAHQILPGGSFILIWTHIHIFSSYVPIDTIRTPARAETDLVYCQEVPASPRPQATGLQALLGSKPNQFLQGRDFFILFHHYDS